jgi:hypothetical protein
MVWSDFDVSSEDVEKAFPGYGDNDDTDEKGIPDNDSWELARLLNIVSLRGLDAIESSDIADVGLTPAQFEKFADQIGASKVYKDSQKPPAAEVDDGEKISAAKEPENKPKENHKNYAAEPGKSVPTKAKAAFDEIVDETEKATKKVAVITNQYLDAINGADLTSAMALAVTTTGESASVEYPEGIYSSGKPCIVFYPGWGGIGGGEGDLQKFGTDLKKSLSQFTHVTAGLATAAAKTALAAVDPGGNTLNVGLDAVTEFMEGTATEIMSKLTTPPATRTNFGLVVALYMPEGIEFSHSADWASEDGGVIRQAMRGSAGLSDVKDRTKENVSDFLQSGVGKDFMARKGKAKKNLRSVMFNGVGFRKFSMAWTFVPKTQKESGDVYAIIRSFKQLMHPETDSSSSTYWVLPGYYNIEVQGVSSVGSFVESALTDIKVTYGSDGRMNVLPDASPSAVTLSLSFTELKQRDSGSF